MRLLLDTHSFLWYITADPRMPMHVRERIDRPDALVFVSLTTFWEVAIKHTKGRLDLYDAPDVVFASELIKNGFVYLLLKPVHVFTASTLPLADHRDPFDRALVAQAKVDDLVLVSVDSKLDRYGVSRLF